MKGFKHNIRHGHARMHDILENKENPLTSLGVKYLRHCSLSDVLSLFTGCTLRIAKNEQVPYFQNYENRYETIYSKFRVLKSYE